MLDNALIKPLNMCLLMVFLLSTVASAEIYKWTNEKGTSGFTDDLSRVPEKYRDTVEIKTFLNASPEGGEFYKVSTGNRDTSVQDETAFGAHPEPDNNLSSEKQHKPDKGLRGIWEKIKKTFKK